VDRPDLERRRRQTRILLDLARVGNAADRLVEGLLAEHDLPRITPAQANALMVLFNARRPLTGAEIARELGISEVTVSRFVRAMRDAGWVERERDPDDARRLLVRPTAQARAALPRFIAVSNTLLDTAFADLDEAACERMAVALEGIRARLDP
jgi:DNA-binding MarR family transcriptional regulator